MPSPKPQLTSDDCFRAYLLIELLRSTGEREFPLQLASTLFYVMSHDGCRMGDLATATGLSSSSVTRNVQWLGEQHRLEDREGLKLIRREQDPEDYKRFRLFLTPKGKQWVNLIGNIKSMSFKEVESHDQDQWESQDLG
jgi:DNA-binding MarR family transcriptional regulator